MSGLKNNAAKGHNAYSEEDPKVAEPKWNPREDPSTLPRVRRYPPQPLGKQNHPKSESKQPAAIKPKPTKACPPPPQNYIAKHQGPKIPPHQGFQNPTIDTMTSTSSSLASVEHTRTSTTVKSLAKYQLKIHRLQSMQQLQRILKEEEQEEEEQKEAKLKSGKRTFQNTPPRMLIIDTDSKSSTSPIPPTKYSPALQTTKSFVLGNEFHIHESGLHRLDLGLELVRLSVLGKGASGTVYRSLYLPTLDLVAVKVIDVGQETKRRQMITEIRTLYPNVVPLVETKDELNHRKENTSGGCPQIVSFFDVFMNHDNSLSIAMEYMDGGSLQDLVNNGGCPLEPVLAQIALDVLKGLQYLHERHQIHRDIKPGNLLINHLGQVKISDFGITRELTSSSSHAQTFVGTLTYMSPERIAGDNYGCNSDIWSLGLSLLTVATGNFPYACAGGYWELWHAIQESPAPQLPNEYSSQCRDFLDLCLVKNPATRPEVGELLTHPFLEQHHQLLENSSPLHSLTNSSPRHTRKQQSSVGQEEEMEIQLIAQKIVHDVYRDKALKLVKQQQYSFQQLVEWCHSLPATTPSMLISLGHQLGIHDSMLVQRIFEDVMNQFLDELYEQHYE